MASREEHIAATAQLIKDHDRLQEDIDKNGEHMAQMEAGVVLSCRVLRFEKIGDLAYKLDILDHATRRVGAHENTQ